MRVWQTLYSADDGGESPVSCHSHHLSQTHTINLTERIDTIQLLYMQQMTIKDHCHIEQVSGLLPAEEGYRFECNDIFERQYLELAPFPIGFHCRRTKQALSDLILKKRQLQFHAIDHILQLKVLKILTPIDPESRSLCMVIGLCCIDRKRKSFDRRYRKPPDRSDIDIIGDPVVKITYEHRTTDEVERILFEDIVVLDSLQ